MCAWTEDAASAGQQAWRFLFLYRLGIQALWRDMDQTARLTYAVTLH
jgi:hypothetical protein